MTDPTVLKRLGTLAQRLNEASDVISKQIVSLEAALNALRLGVWAWVTISRDETYQTDNDGKSYQLTDVVKLGYGKYKGEWALLLLIYVEEFDEADERQVSLLREAKREVKLEAVEKLPELLEEIEKKATEMAENASERAVEISDLARALRSQAGASDDMTSVKSGSRQGK